MNETASDGSDSEKGNGSEIVRDPYLSLPVVSKLNHSAVQQQQTSPKDPEMDFFTQQSKLQVEARKSLAQAKELARVQMQVERQQKKRSLISDLVRQSLEKVKYFKFSLFCGFVLIMLLIYSWGSHSHGTAAV